jgi:hypothetical protein
MRPLVAQAVWKRQDNLWTSLPLRQSSTRAGSARRRYLFQHAARLIKNVGGNTRILQAPGWSELVSRYMKIVVIGRTGLIGVEGCRQVRDSRATVKGR